MKSEKRMMSAKERSIVAYTFVIIQIHITAIATELKKR